MREGSRHNRRQERIQPRYKSQVEALRTKSSQTQSKSYIRSYRCQACGKLRIIRKDQLAQVAIPKCHHRGGQLIETPTSLQRNGPPKPTKKQARAQNWSDEQNRPHECPICEVRFRNPTALAMHVGQNHGQTETIV